MDFWTGCAGTASPNMEFLHRQWMGAGRQEGCVQDGNRLSAMWRYGKRAFDIAGAGAGMVLLVPVLVMAGLAIRLSMGKPLLFRQERVGRNSREFTFLKFRTMTDRRDGSGELLPDAERLTALGRFLRNTSLDELPQLWNVIKGDMSLVGPRPLLPEYLPRYSAFQRRRHEVKPGITGWAQVNGRNALSWEKKFELDVWYVDNWSLWLDLKILWMTVWQVLRREGISQEGHATMSEFMGTSEAVDQNE